MRNFLRWLLNRRAHHEDTLTYARRRGRECALRAIAGRGEGNEVEAVRDLRELADGVFNRSAAEDAFDKGVLEVCMETLQELGHP